MKKKKNKERRAEKKVVKQAEKQKKYCSTALEWSDIEMIDGDAIHIRDGSTRERIIGLKAVISYVIPAFLHCSVNSSYNPLGISI